jgi:hypothetical protein
LEFLIPKYQPISGRDPNIERRTSNIEHPASGEGRLALDSLGRMGIQMVSSLSQVAETAEDWVRAMGIGMGRMITSKRADIQVSLSQLLLAWKSSEMLFAPLAQPGNQGYRFWPV